MSVDLATIARDLKISPEKVEKTVQLLDDGNTIPFITRFRKDETGSLNEKQIQAIKQFVQRKRTLEERKEFILKLIESQEKLTDELKADIGKAQTTRYLEDLYLPFKPKKQSLAMAARQQGLEPLATEIFEGNSPEVDVAARAIDYVRVDKGLSSVDDVIAGVGHLIAERFSENRHLRSELRKIVWNTGQMVSKSCEAKSGPVDATNVEKQPAVSPKTVAAEPTPKVPEAAEPVAQEVVVPDAVVADETVGSISAAMPAVPPTEKSPSLKPADPPAEESAPPIVASEIETSNTESIGAASTEAQNDDSESASPTASTTPPEAAVTDSVASEPAVAGTGDAAATEAKAPAVVVKKKKKKKKKKKTAPDPFQDYFDFKQPMKSLPHHRVLAINRGERAGKLKVKIEVDQGQVKEKSINILVPDSHPSKPFMEKCALDAVSKSVIPSLEREARRELTEAAERHAVEVFASNLKNLLLQPPINNRRILAIDPGFKRGCTVAAIDETGNLLETGQIFVVGNQKRRDESTDKLHQWVVKHAIHTIAIGNGAACRETEQMVSDLLGGKLADSRVNYIILNEAGASTYSTSEIGREELPELSPNERSAVSIGRRLLDPLSELVKISPANIGVGMYQHDVKAKHLSESLDEVVQFCVNRVGVNVNTASPSLLRYVSGLNQLTARRIFEYRNEKGVFNNRQQLKEVTGLGDATFEQAAGFIRIHEGDDPLDSTPIHPESYEVARKILDKIGANAAQLFKKPAMERPRPVAIKTSVESSTVEQATTEGPPAEVSATEVPSGENPTSEDPSSEVPTIEVPSSKVPSSKVPSSEVPTSEETSGEETSGEETSGEETSGEETSGEETSGEETSGEETSGELPSGDATGSAAPINPTVATAPAASPELEIVPESSLPSVTEPASDSTDQKSNDETITAATSNAPHAPERPRRDPQRAAVLAKLKELNIEDLAREFSVGNLLVRDIVKTFSQPHRDPRDGVSKPIFRSGIIKAEDLKIDMQLDAQVVNVVDFGVFVDIGLGESSLIHVSQLSNRFIRNPHQFFSIGDVVKVWVTEIDGQRRRVKLTAVKPGTPKFDPSKAPNRRGRKPQHAKPAERGKTNRGKFKGSGGQRGKPVHARSERSSRRPPKPVKPITEKMLEGKEPMRSFSDLLQFVEKKPSDSAKKKDES